MVLLLGVCVCCCNLFFFSSFRSGGFYSWVLDSDTVVFVPCSLCCLAARWSGLFCAACWLSCCLAALSSVVQGKSELLFYLAVFHPVTWLSLLCRVFSNPGDWSGFSPLRVTKRFRLVRFLGQESKLVVRFLYR